MRGEGGPWVLRRDPEGSVSLVPIRDEFALIARARDAGVPVPEPLALERAGGRLGTDGMLMSFVDGTSVAPRILRKPELRDRAFPPGRPARQALARIHSVDPSDLAGVLPESGG